MIIVRLCVFARLVGINGGLHVRYLDTRLKCYTLFVIKFMIDLRFPLYKFEIVKNKMILSHLVIVHNIIDDFGGITYFGYLTIVSIKQQ